MPFVRCIEPEEVLRRACKPYDYGRLALRAYKIESLAQHRWGVLVFLIGDVDGELPTVQDLEDIRDRWNEIEADMNIPEGGRLFFPPIIEHRALEGCDVFFLGSLGRSILPTQDDLEKLVDILKALGLTNFIVAPPYPEFEWALSNQRLALRMHKNLRAAVRSNQRDHGVIVVEAKIK